MVNKNESKVGEKLKVLTKKKGALPESARKELETNIDKYKRLIMKMAHKYVRSRVEYDDLVQEAMIGLMLAVRDFDPSRSNDFHTYAIYRVKGKMYEYCIGNENPIYVPTHVAKAASYVKQMQRLLERESLTNESDMVINVITNLKHEVEETLQDNVRGALSELKRKLGNIARNSKMTYEKLAGLALSSLSTVVSEDVLAKYPEESGFIEEVVSNRELSEQLRESLGEKRFTVLWLKSLDWNLREIAEHLAKIGYKNRQGRQISRQAVKAILDETLRSVRKMRLFKNMK